MGEASDKDWEELMKSEAFRIHWELCNPVLTQEDRRLRKKVADAYSKDISEHYIIAKDHMLEDWPTYKKGILNLLNRNLTEEQFIEEVRLLNELAPDIL